MDKGVGTLSTPYLALRHRLGCSRVGLVPPAEDDCLLPKQWHVSYASQHTPVIKQVIDLPSADKSQHRHSTLISRMFLG